AARVRLAGTAIKRLGSVGAADAELAEPAEVLTRRADAVHGWYGSLAAGFGARSAPFPSVDCTGGAPSESFLEVVLPAVHGCCDPDSAARAERLLWAGQYLGDVDQLRGDLLEPAAQVATARARPW